LSNLLLLLPLISLRLLFLRDIVHDEPWPILGLAAIVSEPVIHLAVSIELLKGWDFESYAQSPSWKTWIFPFLLFLILLSPREHHFWLVGL
jgi:hypothetical protein